jgi:hypothetical protein
MNDDSKKLVLARRARFIAAAMAGVAGVAAADACAPAEPCLSTYANPGEGGVEADAQACLSVIGDSGNDATPQPCLDPLPPDAGDGGDAGDEDGGDGGDAGDGG